MNNENSSTLILEIENSIATISFNRPKSLNAINPEMAMDFLHAVEEIISIDGIRIIILKGIANAFMAGGDLKCMVDAGDSVPDIVYQLVYPMHKALNILANSTLIVIAQVHGAVVGAGMSIALNSDLTFASNNSQFNMAYINISNTPDCGGSWHLAKHVGYKKAIEISLLGESINANRAKELGIVNFVVDHEHLEKITREYSEKLIKLSSKALGETKS